MRAADVACPEGTSRMASEPTASSVYFQAVFPNSIPPFLARSPNSPTKSDEETDSELEHVGTHPSFCFISRWKNLLLREKFGYRLLEIVLTVIRHDGSQFTQPLWVEHMN